jgi:putative transposase
VVGTAAFRSEPSALDVVRFLRRTCRQSKYRPKHLITDHGAQFTADDFTAWCRRRGIQQRFGAIGKYGSLAVVERFIRSMKAECTRLVLVPFVRRAFQRELDHYSAWFNADRPHEVLAGATPDEVYRRTMPACRKPRFEPREQWPRPSPCA